MKASVIGRRDYIISQGKVIDINLDNAINTLHKSGEVTATVNHDVYSESSKYVLIPRGSKLIGTYSLAGVVGKRGNNRVNLQWSRVIRPDGIDILISATGIDELGRVGVSGSVDNRYVEIFSQAFFVAAFDIGTKYISRNILGGELDANKNINITTNVDGSTTTTGDSFLVGSRQAVDSATETIKSNLDSSSDFTPIIKIPQGERLKVSVEKDWVFPRGAVYKIRDLSG